MFLRLSRQLEFAYLFQNKVIGVDEDGLINAKSWKDLPKNGENPDLYNADHYFYDHCVVFKFAVFSIT